MTTETLTHGKCGNCERSVNKVQNAKYKVLYTNGDKYVYPENSASNYCIFRCDGCSMVIADTWIADDIKTTIRIPTKEQT